MRRRLALVPWVIAGLVVLAAGFFGGRALHPKSGAAYSFQASTPAYEAPKTAAGVDKAGLTGFGEDDLGRTVVAGHVTAFSGDSITLQSSSGVVNTVRLLPQAPLRQLTTADHDALRAGANVIVKLAAPGQASAVLILPAQ